MLIIILIDYTGDSRYKWPISIQEAVLPWISRRGPPKNYLTPPYVTAVPEVAHYRVTPSRDLFLVLATDGLYDELKSEQVVESVAAYMVSKSMVPAPAFAWSTFGNGNSTGKWAVEDENVATHLIRNALGGLDSEKVAKLLAIPSPYSRRFRDDMTVNVVFFGELGGNSKAADGVDIQKVASIDATKTAVVSLNNSLQDVDLKKAAVKQPRLSAWAAYYANLTKSKL
jgi:serine/threonine protein phosphatase PrpC